MTAELQRPPTVPLARLLVDYNPFYLLSAGCMLFSVFAAERARASTASSSSLVVYATEQATSPV